jgi:hypothetical protein
MKATKWLVSICLTLTFFAPLVKGFTINGTYDPGFGSALATQVLATTALDNDMGLIDQADGSELDAAYGVVQNGELYLFLAGNLDSGGTGSVVNTSSVPFDKLNVFIMTGAGGDNTLGTNYSGAADFGGINRMGVSGNGAAGESASLGLTFDPGFAPNYWIGVGVGGAGTNPTMYANYLMVCDGCPGAFMGSAAPSNVVWDTSDNQGLNTGIQVALNNSNTNGVWGDISGCPVNGGTTNNPLSVARGIEMAIPLTAIGSPAAGATITICAFITDKGYDALYNQVLGPVTGSIGNSSTCAFTLSPDGDSSDVYFQNLPGTHTFSISVPVGNSFSASPVGPIAFGNAGGTSNEAVTVVGSYAWTATSSVPWVTITSGASGTGNGTISYTVATNTSFAGRSGFLTITGGQIITIDQAGVVLPPYGIVTVDGTKDPYYGCPLVVQTLGTSFGKNTSMNLAYAGGSELDAAYGLIQNKVLFLFLAGNLQNNYNHLNIFFAGGTGVLNSLTNVEPQVSYNLLNNMGSLSLGSQVTFDSGFKPDYWMGVNIGGSPTTYYLDYAQLWPGGTNASGAATNWYYVGFSTPTNGTLVPATNPFLIQATVNNSNTNGVDGSSCATNSAYQLNSVAAATVTNGIELAIPLQALGSPTGVIEVCAFISNDNGTYISNQILGPIATSGCQGNLASGGTSNVVNFGSLPGQHYFLVGPEMRVTSIAVTNNPSNAVTNNFGSGITNRIAVSYQTEANQAQGITNWLYQLQVTTNSLASGALTNSSVWKNVGNGTTGPGIITTLDVVTTTTNIPAVFYRVRQTPSGCDQ